MGYVVKITREPGKGAVTKADAIAEALLENGKIAEKIIDAMRKKNIRGRSLLRRGCSGNHRFKSSSKTAKNKQK